MTLNQFTFEHIHNAGLVASATDTYIHYHLPDMPLYYDSNYIAFKKMPTVSEFQKAEQTLKIYHSVRDQHHLKFTFPENEPIPKEVKAYLNRNDYDTGFLELYVLDPKDFPEVLPSADVQVSLVTADNLKELLHLHRIIDEQFGKEFAAQKQKMHIKNFSDPNVVQLVAHCDKELAGTVDLIVNEQTVEIDGLYVLVEMRHRGIGTQLQRWLINQYPDKLVILVADGEDTPKEMYQRQNYNYISYQYETVKT
ncbi:GNAT family N-acetyltransferase [Sporosarcina aquimarina]|uniref:GNAT family N-acetyltransferase n=1 Tax=Sporosarcina aquimarina TaxID=114975 RepID=A0ABU4FYL7_9BACL|nr:GNAT family N-acetyltransferase [Sporosarcina aquimarina]MDW0109820.1 GNAT family N-acetyltransferase [Sporosarcina aquimarina]